MILVKLNTKSTVISPNLNVYIWYVGKERLLKGYNFERPITYIFRSITLLVNFKKNL